MIKFSHRISLFLLAITVFACGRSYLPGFNFRSFDDTPVEELARAVEDNDAEAIEEFLAANPDLIDYQEQKFGHTLLFLAVVNGKRDAAESLLENGSDLLIKGYSDSSDVLMTLCEGYGDNECDTGMLNLLLKYHPNLDTYCYIRGTKIPLLCKAASSIFRCKLFIETLVNTGADVNYNPDNVVGLSPVLEALYLDRLDLAHYFLVDCKAIIPDTLFLRPHTDTSKIPVSITMLLNEQDYSKEPQQQKLKQEILDYVKSQGKE